MKTFSTLIAAMFTSVAAHAATVGWQAAIDTGLIDSTGAALAQGNFVRIGYFGTLSDAQVTSNSATLSGISALSADFHEFASTTIGTNTSLNASFALNSLPQYSTLTGFDQVAHPQIYFWVLKATNNSSLANAVSTATESAIAYLPFGSGNTNASAWQFPATDLTPGKTLDLADLAGAGRQVLDGLYVPSGTPSLNGIFGPTNHALQLAVVAVPEPSVLTFSALAAMAFAGVRRRRKA